MIPLLGFLGSNEVCAENLRDRMVKGTRVEWIARNHKRGSFYFAPLVTNELALTCRLEIQFFRREPAGALILQGGDIDNRVKTLFDALRVPEETQVKNMRPAEDETPFFCLLQDDILVTGFSVNTERLLEPLAEGEKPTDVALTIQVVIHTTLASETEAFDRLKPA